MKHVIAAVAVACLIAVPALGQSTGTDVASHPQQEEPPDDSWLGPESAGGDAASEPLHFDIGVRVVSLQEVNASDSYDASFDGDAMTQFGVQFELVMLRHFLIGLVYETGEVDGHQLLSVDPLVRSNVEETLTLSPIHLTFGWVFAPTAPLHGFVGVGPTLLDWEDKTQANPEFGTPGQAESGSDVGYHAAAGLRWATFNHRLILGGELRFSSVPDAVGEAGATRLFDEDDLGGTTVGLSLLWRVR